MYVNYSTDLRLLLGHPVSSTVAQNMLRCVKDKRTWLKKNIKYHYCNLQQKMLSTEQTNYFTPHIYIVFRANNYYTNIYHEWALDQAYLTVFRENFESRN